MIELGSWENNLLHMTVNGKRNECSAPLHKGVCNKTIYVELFLTVRKHGSINQKNCQKHTKYKNLNAYEEFFLIECIINYVAQSF